MGSAQHRRHVVLDFIDAHGCNMTSARKTKRIEEVEAEYGQEFEALLSDFARDYSYSFTMKTLGLAPDKWKEYQHLFTPHKQGEREWLSERNRRNAKRYGGYTIRDLMDATGLAKTSIRQRLAKGMTAEQIINTPRQKAGIENLKGKRNNDTFRKAIDKRWKDQKEQAK